MERAKKILNDDLILLISFSTLVVISMTLMLLKAFEFRIVSGNLATDFQVALTPDYVIVESPCSNIITSYSVPTSSNDAKPQEILVKIFPLKLPRTIKAYNKTICLKAWYLNLYRVFCINYTEVRGGGVFQKACIVDLKFHLEGREISNSSSHFKLIFEVFEKPHESEANGTVSGFLESSTGQLYGGFYLSSTGRIGMSIKWDPVDKPIAIIVYHESGRVGTYMLTGGEWSGYLKAVDAGLNCLIIINLNQEVDITYSVSFSS